MAGTVVMVVMAVVATVEMTVAGMVAEDTGVVTVEMAGMVLP